MYESMQVWETQPELALGSAHERDFAEVWQAADKIVYSRTLETAPTRKTHIERSFDAEAIRKLKASAKGVIMIGGPELAAQAFRSGLIDEFHVFLYPISLGGGKRCLPEDVRLELELVEERRFGNGVVYLRYRVKQGQ
jgi:dihydrofolate reductase